MSKGLKAAAMSGLALLSAFGTTACMRNAEAADATVTPASVETSGYSYNDALAKSHNGVVLYSADDVYGADDVAWDVSEEAQVYAEAIVGNSEPGSVRLLVYGQDHGVYGQRDINRGKLGTDAIKYASDINPRRVSVLEQ